MKRYLPYTLLALVAIIALSVHLALAGTLGATSGNTTFPTTAITDTRSVSATYTFSPGIPWRTATVVGAYGSILCVGYFDGTAQVSTCNDATGTNASQSSAYVLHNAPAVGEAWTASKSGNDITLSHDVGGTTWKISLILTQ